MDSSIADAYAGSRVETVALAAQSRDEIGLGELSAKATDVRIDGASLGFEAFPVPHRFQQFFSGNDLIGMSSKVGQEFVFPVGELDRIPLNLQAAVIKIDMSRCR